MRGCRMAMAWQVPVVGFSKEEGQTKEGTKGGWEASVFGGRRKKMQQLAGQRLVRGNDTGERGGGEGCSMGS